MSAAVSREQIRAIHALKKAAALDQEAYRDLLSGLAGVRSSTELTHGAAVAVIDRLKVIAGQSGGPSRRSVDGRRPRGTLALTGRYAGICRALWISAWHLGVVEAREDTALVAFVRRQTGIDHLNWLRDAADAQKVIEALKAWLTREAGVKWPRRSTQLLPSGDRLDLRKWAVVKAQLALLGRHEERISACANADLDALMSRLGAEIRRSAINRSATTADVSLIPSMGRTGGNG